MKKHIILLLLAGIIFGISHLSNAQNNWSLNGSDIYNNNSGNVGVGTILPNAKLEVQSPILADFMDENGNQTCFGIPGLIINGLDDIQTYSQGCINIPANLFEARLSDAFGANDLKVVIDGYGNLGLGHNITPTELLDVDGNIRMRAGAQTNYVISGDQNGVMNWTDINTLLPPTPASLWEPMTNSSPGVGHIRNKENGEVHIGNVDYALFFDPFLGPAHYKYMSNLGDVGMFFGPTYEEATEEFEGGASEEPGLVIGSRNHENGWAGLRMDWDGNVCIGCDNTEGYKLAVNGNMVAELVRVKLKGNWPDYVFEEGYKLAPLTDVEAFIQENGHLPNLPAAKDIQKEGVDLGEMNRLLLEKVEELTLYVIDLEKKILEVK